jgi:molybdenum cofactor cytidylyltransferase
VSLAAAVLAAGTSSRMGRNKMLLELNGEPLVRRAVRTVLEARFLEVTVVVGREPELIAAALEGMPCRFAFNPDFATQGMEASLRTAVTNIPDDSSGLLFTLADQVFVTSSMMRTLIESRGDALVAASRFGDVIAPPHLFSSALFEVLGTPGNGAKPLIQKHLERVVFVDQPVEALFDLDTLEDYEHARQLLER